MPSAAAAQVLKVGGAIKDTVEKVRLVGSPAQQAVLREQEDHIVAAEDTEDEREIKDAPRTPVYGHGKLVL